jgi:WD40 repeat protein
LDTLRRSAMFVLPNAGGPVAFSPDGTLIATGGGSDPSLKFWDATTGERLDRLISHTGHLSSVEFSADGKYLVSSGGEDGMAILWELSDRLPADGLREHSKGTTLGAVPIAQKIGVFAGHARRIHSARFFPDGERLATADAGGVLAFGM